MPDQDKKITIAQIRDAMAGSRNMTPAMDGMTLEAAIAELERQGWIVTDKPAAGIEGSVEDTTQNNTSQSDTKNKKGTGRHRRPRGKK